MSRETFGLSLLPQKVEVEKFFMTQWRKCDLRGH